VFIWAEERPCDPCRLVGFPASLMFPMLNYRCCSDLASRLLGQSNASDNLVVRWNVAALQGVRDSRIGPPMVARALAIVHTCIFDAWAAYDKRAVGIQFG
jgi:hypothetical protein